MSAEMVLPPSLDTEDGQPRMIGVELEFAGMSCEQAAGLVCDLFGGRIEPIDPHRFEVTGTRFGSFTVELDSQYAHTDDNDDAAASSWDDIGRAVRDGLTTTIATVTSLWLPIEIVSPPVPLAALPELDSLVQALRGRGAEGCSDGLVYAFATQLNPEVPSLRGESVLAHLQAFLLLSETLRAAIDVDLLRRALPFANPFPSNYVEKVVDPNYQPGLRQLVDDYLEANPTRNRELDLLPLFTHIDPERVRAKVEDALIKARPTFHYRLPDTRVSDPAWSLILEWNRWVEVEHLAADAAALRRLSGVYLDEVKSRRPRALAEAIDGWRAERSAGR